jgi:SulP family sulfate permease
VNALAILIFMAQLTHFTGQSWIMYAMVGGTLAIIYILPRFIKVVPSPLVAIIVMSMVAIAFHLDLRTVGDMGEIKQALPLFHIPHIPLTWEMFTMILPYSFTLALVGILESLMTATILDEMTETKSEKNQEVKGQGIANIVTGFFGGMAGCAMIGQSVINVKSGGRGRLSTLVAGVFLLFLIMVLGDIVKQIPMAALVGVMIMVSIGTFDWQSLRSLHRIPRSDVLVMVVTVAIVVATHDLAKGVITGVVLSAVLFGWKIARLDVSSKLEDESKVYHISGQLFFGTMSHFTDLFTYQDDPKQIVIDLTHSHVWDQSAVTAIAKVQSKFKQLEKEVMIRGLNEESKALMNRIGYFSSLH